MRRDERGIALPMVLGMMLIFGISLATVIMYSRSAEQDAQQGKRKQAVYSGAEAALATAVSTLASTANPWSSTALPACTAPTAVSVVGAAADFCGSLAANQ